MQTVAWTVDEEVTYSRTVWALFVKVRANFQCEICGERNKRLDAHHINGNGKDHRPINGQCLCISCHSSLTASTQPPATQEHREKISRAHKGRQVSSATKIRMSKAAKLRPKGPKKDPITHCKRGHEFTEENTRIRSSGTRACKMCASNRQKQYAEEKRKKRFIARGIVYDGWDSI